MDLTLTPEMQRFVDAKVKSGQYAGPQEVVRAALATFMRQDGAASIPFADLELLYPGLRQKIAAGLADVDAGRMTDGEEFFDQLDHEERSAGRKTA